MRRGSLRFNFKATPRGSVFHTCTKPSSSQKVCFDLDFFQMGKGKQLRLTLSTLIVWNRKQQFYGLMSENLRHSREWYRNKTSLTLQAITKQNKFKLNWNQNVARKWNTPIVISLSVLSLREKDERGCRHKLILTNCDGSWLNNFSCQTMKFKNNGR